MIKFFFEDNGRARLLIVFSIVTLWFLRDLAWATMANYFPKNYIVFLLCSLVLLPTTLLKKEYFALSILVVGIISFVLAPLFIFESFSDDIELLRYYTDYFNDILSYTDIFIVSSLLALFVQSRPRLVKVPLALFAGLGIIYMISTIHYRF